MLLQAEYCRLKLIFLYSYIHLNLIALLIPVNCSYSRIRLVVFASCKAMFLNFRHSAAPNPNNNRLRRPCFTKRRAPSEALIGGNICMICHLRKSSVPNSVGGERTRTFFTLLTNRWRSDIFGYLIFFEDFFGFGCRMHRTDLAPVRNGLG